MLAIRQITIEHQVIVALIGKRLVSSNDIIILINAGGLSSNVEGVHILELYASTVLHDPADGFAVFYLTWAVSIWIVDVVIFHENFALLNEARDLLIHRDLLFSIPDAVEFELEHPGMLIAFW